MSIDEKGRLFLITYDYVESGVAQRCGFICHAKNVRDAAESFWQQHPSEWFHLIAVNDGSNDMFDDLMTTCQKYPLLQGSDLRGQVVSTAFRGRRGFPPRPGAPSLSPSRSVS